MRILVVEDNAEMAALVCEVLRDDRYAVDLATSGAEADELIFVNPYDLVVLDWGIPAPTGLELLRRWRDDGREMPVLMLTARDTVEDRIGGLDTGADDYLTKPFAVGELLARVRSLLRRREKPLTSRLATADLELDRSSHRVTLGGSLIELSPKEFAVLEALLDRRDQVLSRSEIEESAWDHDSEPMANVVDVIIHRLRKKIDGGRDGRLIHTVRGAGYVLRSERS